MAYITYALPNIFSILFSFHEGGHSWIFESLARPLLHVHRKRIIINIIDSPFLPFIIYTRKALSSLCENIFLLRCKNSDTEMHGCRGGWKLCNIEKNEGK